MGFFDRLLKSDSKDSDGTIQPRAPKKEKPQEFFLDSDASSSLGDVNYMRESKTIRAPSPEPLTIREPRNASSKSPPKPSAPRNAVKVWAM